VVQFSLFVPSERDVKMAASREVCTMDEQRAVVSFLLYEMYRKKPIDDWLPSIDRNVCHNEGFPSGLNRCCLCTASCHAHLACPPG
jgi:hypothetical protein